MDDSRISENTIFPFLYKLDMKALIKFFIVGASAFALFGLSSCCDSSAPAAETPVYVAPAK